MVVPLSPLSVARNVTVHISLRPVSICCPRLLPGRKLPVRDEVVGKSILTGLLRIFELLRCTPAVRQTPTSQRPAIAAQFPFPNGPLTASHRAQPWVSEPCIDFRIGRDRNTNAGRSLKYVAIAKEQNPRDARSTHSLCPAQPKSCCAHTQRQHC
jgi:hypothetical protein